MDLAHLFANALNQNRDRCVREVLERIQQECSLRVVIAEYLRDKKNFGHLEKAVVIHPNGFTKFTITRNITGHALRLHVWLPCPKGQKSDGSSNGGNIHNHRWEFASVVVAGTYTQELFSISDTGTLYEKYHYADEVDAREFMFIGRERLIRTHTNHYYVNGCMNILCAEKLHRITPSADHLTASVFVTAPATRKSTDVYSPYRIASRRKLYPYAGSVEHVRAVRDTLIVALSP